MSNGIEQRYNAAIEIIREAGRIALDYFHAADYEIESKGLQDRVSVADREVERIIAAALNKQFPNDGFVGEEFGARDTDAEFVWVVDPIDGTDCFVHRIPAWSVSIGLLLNGQPCAGLVLHPPSGELFHARRGNGAWCNDEQIKTSDATSLTDGLVSVGFSYRADPVQTLRLFEKLFDARGMFQRNGSAALSLAYVASGRYLGFIETHINAWDVLGGLVLVCEAGGYHSRFLDNDGLTKGNPVVAGATGVESALTQLFNVTTDGVSGAG